MGVSRRNSQRLCRKTSRAGDSPRTVRIASRSSSTSGSSTTATSASKQGDAEAPAVFILDANEVVAAAESLYDDQLKPFGRILRKRVAERAAVKPITTMDVAFQRKDTSGSDTIADAKEERVACECEPAVALPNVDMKQLRSVCNACPKFRLEDEDGGDWSVLLIGRDADFVDVYDPEDVYSADLWAEVSAYFCTLVGTPSQFLPGGRYACAKALAARRPEFLAGLSMGRICHVVQLAISQKKILGYLNGAVVPYECSQSMMKEHRAELQLPFSKPINDNQEEMPFADLDTARTCLRAILDVDSLASPRRTSCGMPLSNIKRLFRSRFNLELSETMLGHSKLSDLLQDERFSEVCEVKIAGSGYIVHPKANLVESQVHHDVPHRAPPGLLPPDFSQRSLPPAPPPIAPPLLPPGLVDTNMLTIRAPPGLPAPLAIPTRAQEMQFPPEEEHVVPKKVLPTSEPKPQQQISLPKLLGRHTAPMENQKLPMSFIVESKLHPVAGTRSGSPPTHEQTYRNSLPLYQDGAQHQGQQRREQPHQLREQSPFQTPQHLAKDPLAFAIKRLIDHGMDPALAYATVIGQPVTRPGAVGYSSVAHLQPAMSTFGGRSNQTLALSELLPR